MSQRSSEVIKKEIVAHLGFFPPFYEPAFETPAILENLWQQTLSAYIENPIPILFKEKLAASLARFCTVPYCLLCHSSALRPLGMESSDVLTLLQESPIDYVEFAENAKIINQTLLTEWPEAGSLVETGILHCCIAIFLNQDTEGCQQTLKQVLPEELYNYLCLFISYNRTCLTWAEMHPELNYLVDKRDQEHVGYHPFRNSEGKIKGVLAIHQNVTEQVAARNLIETNRMQLAFEKLKLQTIVIQSPAAIALWSGADLIFEIANPEFQKIFPGRKLIGKPLLEACPELKGKGFAELLIEVMRTGKPYTGYEVRAHITNDLGEIQNRYYDFTYIQIKDAEGNVYGVYDHAIDVTDRVTQRLDLENAKIEAERAYQTKSSFLANMSHEIRTPLGAILGFTDLLKEGHLNSKDRDQYLDTISRNGKALTKIIDDILDLAKVESGKLDVEKIEFSLLDLLDEVLDIFRERTKFKGIYLRMNMGKKIPNRISSDPTRLRQIFINILGNAVKFTESGGVTIQVETQSVDDKRIKFIIAVQDTGVGVSQEQRQRLFQPFSQADNTTTRKYGGTGLGLVLSERLANALGGNITIDDPESGPGSVFTIHFVAELPLARPVAAAVANLPGLITVNQSNSLHGLRVLVADDSIDNQFLVRKILTNHEATVETAKNGLEAFRLAMDGAFDIVLMDIQMPEMDGCEATRSLRAAGYKKPIIALTAHAMTEERARTRAAGCDGHLTKPLNKIELLETVERHARRHLVH